MRDSEKKALDELLGRLERVEISGVSIDSRNIKTGELFVAIKGDRFDGHDFVSEAIRKGAWGALVERSALEIRQGSLNGIRNILPVEDTLLALQEMSLMHRKKFPIPLVGITGTNGKTTTKEMLAAIMTRRGPVLKNEGNLNNHIGVPLTLLKLNANHRSGVVEMGMSAPGEIDLLARLADPDVAVITNVGPAHLEFLGTTERVAEAKAEILSGLKPGGAAVLNADDRYFDLFKRKWNGRVLSFGIEHQADVSAADIHFGADFTDCRITAPGGQVNVRLRIVGRHNIYNALAASAAAVVVGMPMNDVRAGLDDFVPLAMRSEFRRIRGRAVLADYYNANPASVKAALEALASLAAGRKSIAVLGDMLELGETAPEAHREIGRVAARLGVGVLITVGELSKLMLEGAREAGMQKDRLFAARSHADAATLLEHHSGENDVVLIKGSRGMKMEKILEGF